MQKGGVIHWAPAKLLADESQKWIRVPKKPPTSPKPKPTTSRTHSLSRLSDKALIARLRAQAFGPIKGLYRRLKAELSYIREARKRWGNKFQGRRVPVPGEPTWTEFVEQELGVSIRTIQKWLAEDDQEQAASKKHIRDKYDSADIAHLENVAQAAQQLADSDPDNQDFEPIRKAIRERPSGFVIREGRVALEKNKWYEGNKNDGKHYHLTPALYWADIQRRRPGIVDILPYPRPEGYDALSPDTPWPKVGYANIPFGTTINPVTGKKEGPTAWAKRGIIEQAKGNSTLYPFPVDWFFFLLIEAGAIITPIGRVDWVATEDGSSQPSGRNIVELFLPGKDLATEQQQKAA
ncbi:MAG: hypothetical protein ABSB87_13730 [Terriglobales bacterium]